MIDNDLAIELHDALRDEFGRSTGWPARLRIAEKLLTPIVWYMGEEAATRYFEQAQWVAGGGSAQTREADDIIQSAWASAPPIVGRLGEMDLIWPSLHALRETVGAELWERFVSSISDELSGRAERHAELVAARQRSEDVDPLPTG